MRGSATARGLRPTGIRAVEMGRWCPPRPMTSAFPGFPYTSRMARPTLINSDGMPPTKGAAYPVFVPKTDADGRDLAGLRLPTLEAPAATHTGWNIRKAGFGEGELC